MTPSTEATHNRAFLIGLASGALVMTFFGAIWALEGVFTLTIGGPAQLSALIGVAVIVAALIVGGVTLIRRAARLPHVDDPLEEARERKAGRWFGIIFGVEFLLIALVSTFLGSSGHSDFIQLAIMLIVGVHFFPLAALFHVRLYYVTGALLSLIVIVIALAVPSAQIIGQASAWVTLPYICSAIMLWATAVAALLLTATLARAAQHVAAGVA